MLLIYSYYLIEKGLNYNRSFDIIFMQYFFHFIIISVHSCFIILVHLILISLLPGLKNILFYILPGLKLQLNFFNNCIVKFSLDGFILYFTI